MKTFNIWVIILSSCVPVFGNVARILYYDKPSQAPDMVHMYVNNELHGDVELPKFKFGKNIELKAGDEDLQIVFSPQLIEKGQKLPPGLPSIRVRKAWKKFLIVAVEDKKNKLLPIKPFAINANESHFGNGDFLFFNLTPNMVGGTIGDKRIKVAPSKRRVVKMSDYEGEFLDVKLDYVRPHDKGKRRWMIYQGWRILSDRRTLVFCYVPEGSKTMKYFATQVKNM